MSSGMTLFAVMAFAISLPHSGTQAFLISSKIPSRLSSPRLFRSHPTSVSGHQFRASPTKHQNCRSPLALRMADGEDAAQEKFNALVEKSSAKEAINLLRANEDLAVSDVQGWKLLNSIPLELSEKTETEQQILTSLAYSSLRKKKLLRAFGCVEPSPLSLPYASKDIDVPTLESTISLPLKALTPRGTQFAWQIAGLVLCTIEYQIASGLGIDPLKTVIPLTAAAFIVDRLALSGAVFESAYRLLFPVYKEKVIKHEAGHFLLAYLLGCPIQGFFLSAWDATRAGIRGQAGTVFFDNDLSTQLNANKVTRTAIDRYTIVLMGGIAAEAISFEQAEGGASDESALVNFLIGLTPAWSQERVLNQARWAVTEAVLLLREHKDAFTALTEAMAANKPLGECVEAIERALGGVDPLPAVARAEARRRDGTFDTPTTSLQTEGPPPSLLLEDIEKQIAEKRAKLDEIKTQEEDLKAQMRSLDEQSVATDPDAKVVWDKAETQRFMDTLLKASRKRKAAEKSGKGGGGGGGGAGEELDAMLAEAARSKQLAEIDLALTQKRVELAKVEEAISNLSAAEAADTSK